MKYQRLVSALACLGAVGPISGQESSFALEEVVVGRLVDVHGVDRRLGGPSRLAVWSDVLVGPDAALEAGGKALRLELDPITGARRLVVAHGDPAQPDGRFAQLVERARSGVRVLVMDGLGVPELPRDGALSLRFGAPLETRHAAHELLSLRVDGEAWSAYTAFEWAPGAGAPSGIVVDFTRDADGAPALLPADATVELELAHVAEPAVGRFAVVRSTSGQALSVTESLVLETGFGPASVLGNDAPPQVIGSQPALVEDVVEINHPVFDPGTTFRATVTFQKPICALDPARGDILELAAGLFRVVRGQAVAPATVAVVLRAIAPGPFDPAQLEGLGLYLAPFQVGDVAECFVTFVPDPGDVPAEGVDPQVNLLLRFSKAMDAGSVQAFDSLMIASTRTEPSTEQIVAAQIESTQGATQFVVRPLLPLDHEQGIAEPYYLLTNDATTQLADVGGNELATDLPIVRFTVDAAEPSHTSGTLALVFDEDDEDGDGFPELRGQLLHDFEAGVVRARPVSRFVGSTERQQPVVALMPPFAQGVQTPLSPLGSKLMHVWRYCDFTFSLTQEFFYNLDVEGLSWAPRDGVVIGDQFEEFRIRLTHGNRLPDERLGPTSNLPEYPQSGLRKGDYESVSPIGNLLSDPLNPLTEVHPREKGYFIDPTDVFDAPFGSKMIHYPLNQDPDPSDDVFYTWRDTAILGKGAPDGTGADLHVLVTAGLIAPGAEGGTFAAGQVPSVGLPLLMEYSCYPTDRGLGLNALDVSLAINSSGQPNFRLFSTGGIDAGGGVVVKDPDDEDKATGGFNPSAGGIKTKGFDNAYYHGAIDFVVRVSRAHTRWFDHHVPSSFVGPVLEPTPGSLPGATDVRVEFRGALAVPEAVPGSSGDADTYDAYGDATFTSGWGQPFLSPVQYLNDDPTWKGSLDEIEGARFVQMRFTLVSDPSTGDVPFVSAVAYGHQPL